MSDQPTPLTDAKEHECNRMPLALGYLAMRDYARDLESQNAKLREALAPFANGYQAWMAEYSDDVKAHVFPSVTIGDFRRAAALAGKARTG